MVTNFKNDTMKLYMLGPYKLHVKDMCLEFQAFFFFFEIVGRMLTFVDVVCKLLLGPREYLKSPVQ